ncbi:hypothetical protein [Roseivirga sp.]|uniref:hypothetical protein n=1 Tax=Roseivirga sp. TaxID=1964215 RepID=UPI003B8CFAC6
MLKITLKIVLALVVISNSLHSFQANPEYELVISDSIIINKLEILQVADYNPKTNNFLVYGTTSKKCLEIDFQGNILSEVDLSGEGPGHFGRGMSALGYIGDNKVIEGAASYIFFDKDWNYQNKFTPGSSMIPLVGLPYDLTGLMLNGKPTVLRYINQNYFGSMELKKGHFSSAKMIEAFNGESEKAERHLDYPKNTVYQDEETYYDSHLPRLSINKSNGLFYVALPLEKTIYTYNPKKEFNLVNEFPIKLERFKEPEGIPFGDQLKNPGQYTGRTNRRNTILRMTNSAILDIHAEGNTIIIEHQTGLKKSNYNTARQANPDYVRLNKYITTFVKDEKVVLTVEKRFKQLVRLDENRFITPYVTGEDEELDYNKFYIYELRKAQ